MHRPSSIGIITQPFSLQVSFDITTDYTSDIVSVKASVVVSHEGIMGCKEVMTGADSKCDFRKMRGFPARENSGDEKLQSVKDIPHGAITSG